MGSLRIELGLCPRHRTEGERVHARSRPAFGFLYKPFAHQHLRQQPSRSAARGKGFGNKTQDGKDKEVSRGGDSAQLSPGINAGHGGYSQGPVEPNELLKKFFETRDKASVAEQYASSLSEKFFFVLNSFMGMASKEGNAEVIASLKESLAAAMEVKQRSLRPEIQLLNQLLSDRAFADRAVRLSSEEALRTLKMNDGYFFELLKLMTADAKGAPKNEYSTSTLQKLTAIQAECTARLQASED